MNFRIGVAAGVAVAIAACGGPRGGPRGGSNPDNVSMAGSGYVSDQLGAGTVAALPSGTLFIRVDAVSGAQQPTKSTLPGIVYVLDGSVRIDAGGSSTTVAKDQAAFLGPTAKLSSSDASARFYLFTASATTTRTAVSPFAGAQIFYATDDLPSLPVMNQDEALVETTIQQGGSSPATRPNGVQVMIDLASAMDLSGGGTDIHRINAGDGRFVLQGSFVQLINRGDGAARYLSFYLLPHGLPLTVKAG